MRVVVGIVPFVVVSFPLILSLLQDSYSVEAAKKKKKTFYRAITPVEEGMVDDDHCKWWSVPGAGYNMICEKARASIDGLVRVKMYWIAVGTPFQSKSCEMRINGKLCKECDACGILADVDATFDCGNLIEKAVPDGDCPKKEYRRVGQNCEGKRICKKVVTPTHSCKKVGAACFKHAACCGKCWKKRFRNKKTGKVVIRRGPGSCVTAKRYRQLLSAFRRKNSKT